VVEGFPGVPRHAVERLEHAWQDLQRDLLRLSTRSEQIIATGSGHYIQLMQPEIVVSAIRELVEQARSKQ
jgi:hypothetical protein